MPPLPALTSLEEAQVIARLAFEHDRHRRWLLSSFGALAAIFPLVAVVFSWPLVGVRTLLPLLLLSVSGFLGILLTRRGFLRSAFAIIAAASAAVIFDVVVLQRINSSALSYLPTLILVASMVFGTREMIVTTISMLVVIFFARIAMFESYTLDWFGLTLDLVSILLITMITQLIDRRRVERDRDLLRGALIDLEHRHRKEAALMSELSQSARAAHAANDAKTKFLLRVSHELRTPLNAIIGYTELLAEEEAFPSLFRGDLSSIDRASRALLRLVEDVLDISRIESGEITLVPEQIELAELIAPVIEEGRALAELNGNRLEAVIGEGSAEIDVGKLRTVIGQLLSNAARFTQHGTIVVRLSCVSKVLRAEVEDSGSGIAKEQLPYIFLPFVQGGTDAACTSGGRGLGLAIVDRIVRGMSGRIEVESEIGRGSLFRVILPA